MKKINQYVDEKTQEIMENFSNGNQSVEAYIKAASFLAFSQKQEEAIELLQQGLLSYPNNEEIIRAIFSFLCQSYKVLQALDFAEEYHLIFKDDEFNNIQKAMDLVRLSFNFTSPESLSAKELAEVDQILYMYSEEAMYDAAMVTVGIMEEYHLPFVGLGIAKFLADEGDDFAQMVLGGAYLKGYHVEKDLHKAEHYLSLSSQANNKEAIALLEQATSKTNLN